MSIQKFCVLPMILLLFVSTIPMSGCTITSSELRADGTVVVTALNSLAAVVSVNDAATAAKITEASQVIEAAVNSSSTGTSLEQALSAGAASAEVILSSIPQTAQYSTLVAIAVAALETLISSIPVTSLRSVTNKNSAQVGEYSRIGAGLIHHRFARSDTGDFKASWNSEAKRLGYSSVVIK